MNITNVNDVAPVISSSATFSAAENQTSIGTEKQMMQKEMILLMQSRVVRFYKHSGVLSFVSAPDYESKTAYKQQ